MTAVDRGLTAALDARPRMLTLSDGRRLSYAEYGDPTGPSVLYLHGAPGSRLEPAALGLDATATHLGIRIIAPDRPGIGASTPQPGRTIAAWGADAAALARHLRLERFAVFGYSAGAAYAAATAASLPDQVTGVALVAPVAHLTAGLDAGLDPDVQRVQLMARTHPRRARLVLNLTIALPARLAPGAVPRLMSRSAPNVDRGPLSRPPLRAGMAPVLRMAFQQGAAGPQQDMALMRGPWGVDLAAVTARTDLWQGTEDSFAARPAMAEHLHARLPHARLHLLPEGHLSILTEHRSQILAGLAN